MIISFGHRYIFVHIPKTGGTSLTLALEERLKKDDIVIGDTPKAQKRRNKLKGVTSPGRLWKHSGLRDIDALVGAGDLDGYFIFTLVRNPWDRMVSYYHWLQQQTFDHPAVTLARSQPFERFVMDPATAASFQASTTASYLTDINGQVRHAHYIRLEHLQQDLKPLQDHLGFALGPVGRVNASPRAAGYQTYYTDQSKARVAALSADDIARFDYQF